MEAHFEKICCRSLSASDPKARPGSIAKTIRPHFLQVFIRKDPALTNPMDFERKLYIIRKMAEKKIIPASQEKGSDFYIASLSSRTIVYKGMLTSIQLRHFYLDLSDLDFTTSMALVHSRFSTNTFPSWARAHPNRYIVHNGEINTIQGNINWLNAREGKSKSSDFPDLEKVFPSSMTAAAIRPCSTTVWNTCT